MRGSGKSADRRRHFTHSKVMAWVALAARSRRWRSSAHGDVEQWRPSRKAIHEDICNKGFDTARTRSRGLCAPGSWTAAVLMIALVGFLPATDRVWSRPSS